MPGTTFVGITEATGANINQRLGAHAVDIGGTTVLREETVWAGTSSGQVAQFASVDMASNTMAPAVRLVPSTIQIGAVQLLGNASVQGNVSAAVAGNVTAVAANSSGVITTANPLAVYLQGSTGDVAVHGNVSAAISGNTTAVVANSSGLVTTANPLAVYLQGSTATVTVQGNVSAAVAGNVTAILTTASLIRVDLSTGSPAYVAFNGVTASGGLVMMGLDGTATNSTARPLQINASGELKVTGSLSANPVGNVAINTTIGTTMLLVGGADANTSNGTARPLNVNASRELVITGAVTVAGNASVQGNVSAVISGNATAVLSNTSGNITTGNPLAVYLQGSTATVTVQGNVTAIQTTASIVRVEVGSSGFPVSGNVTAIITTGSKIVVEGGPLSVGLMMNQVYQGTTVLTPQYAGVTVSASGTVAIVTSVTGRIVVLSLVLTNMTSGTVQFLAGTTALCGPMPIDARSGFVLPYNPLGWFRTATGDALNIALASSTGPCGGFLTYVTPST